MSKLTVANAETDFVSGVTIDPETGATVVKHAGNTVRIDPITGVITAKNAKNEVTFDPKTGNVFAKNAVNEFKFDPNKKAVTAYSYVQASSDYTCACSNKFEIKLDWPENVTMKTSIALNDVVCPACQRPVVFPLAHYHVENYRLLSKPLDEVESS